MNNRFRHQLHVKSPALKQIAEAVSKYGHYYFDRDQKRKPASWKVVDCYVVLEVDILN